MILLGEKLTEEKNDPANTRMASRNLQGRTGRDRRCSKCRSLNVSYGLMPASAKKSKNPLTFSGNSIRTVKLDLKEN